MIEPGMFSDILLFVAIGFAAQMVDGALGMAYGLTASSILLSMGVPPVTASASVHTAEMFTTAASGYSHWKLGNIDKQLLLRLAPAGVIGGVIGAYIISSLDGDVLKPYINGYLALMGCYILYRAVKGRPTIKTPSVAGTVALGGAGGALDAIGGGGWGPMVTTTLIGSGTAPRQAIGSANLAEFFVTTAISFTFIASVGIKLLPVIVGLVIGGCIAAPLAAHVTRRLPQKYLMLIVGTVITLLSLNGLLKVL